jgi:hypothetical protein
MRERRLQIQPARRTYNKKNPSIPSLHPSKKRRGRKKGSVKKADRRAPTLSQETKKRPTSKASKAINPTSDRHHMTWRPRNEETKKGGNRRRACISRGQNTAEQQSSRTGRTDRTDRNPAAGRPTETRPETQPKRTKPDLSHSTPPRPTERIY